MKYLLVALLSIVLTLALIDNTNAQDLKSEENAEKKYIEERDTFSYNGMTLQYMLVLPADYSRMDRAWPMILFLHGGSGRGQNLDLVKSYGPPLIAEEQKNFPFVVLAPQCPEGEYWTTKADILAALLDDVLKRYQIDPDRVYLTGTSMGGNGTWNLVCQHPEYFAAVTPMAAIPSIPNIWNKRLISMPIWAFHGDKDTICPIETDEAMINALRAHGASPRFTILQGKGHYIGEDMYKNQDLYDWFLTNTRQH